jgi:serine/threonine protein kinase
MHRNLKPENVLITQDHQIKISDFNLSRLVQGSIVPYTPEDPKDRERSGRESKRLWYRAPELLMRKTLYAHEIDVWSFGCLMAEIALGEPLFNGDSEIS